MVIAHNAAFPVCFAYYAPMETGRISREEDAARGRQEIGGFPPCPRRRKSILRAVSQASVIQKL